jgi:hypothetical protein
MIWKLFRPKPIVVIELPYKDSLDPKIAEEVLKTMVEPLKKDYYVVVRFSPEIQNIKVEVHNGSWKPKE